MKTNFLLFCFLMLGTSTIFGQSLKKETLSQNGSSEFVYANNKSYFIQQSIGQSSIINTFTANDHELRQGFLQKLKAHLINNGFDTQIEVTAFPNPFQQSINLQFEETLVDVIKISLHHISGQLVYTQTFDPNESLTIQFDNLPVGSYLLRGQMRSQAFAIKLIKH